MNNSEKKLRKGIYLLPNLLTTGALFAGFYAIVAATKDQFAWAAIAIIVALFLDFFDGRIARLTHTTSKFGAQYDSISDMVSFGVAPALVVYEWAFLHFSSLPWVWSKLGWLAAFFYTAAVALRLARFNARVTVTSKRYFQGLPSPAAAAALVGFIWTCHDMQLSREDFAIAALVLTILLGALMVSNFTYYSFKDINLSDRIPYIVMLAVVLGFILISIDPPKLMFALFVVYALSGPVLYLVRLKRKRKRSARATVNIENQ
ncbi:MAG: CDP-diacylglycerol--serine O-phosphatidyltransferase [Gammaproteobacteria bacterium]|nr:CDP-diacylglycerol--serine O-phosphatidyltransferase [Gammaproteobacteria bacterium]